METRGSRLMVESLLKVPRTNEPGSRGILCSYSNGVFLGYSSTYMQPVFIDFDSMMNPHALIIGMTGSGKTYLMKSLALKLSVISGCNIILIDFVGEYREFAKTFGVEYHKSETNDIDYEQDGVLAYFDLSSLGEKQRANAAEGILGKLVSKMRGRDLAASRRVFVFFDEAWKLLHLSESLQTLIREGRKYGIGLILASQILEDADLVVTSNIATLFIFRTQERGSIERLSKNYLLPQADSEAIQKLGTGSFFLIRIYKSDERTAFAVRKFLGVKLENMLRIAVDGMEIEIGLDKLNRVLGRVCDGDALRQIVNTANERKSIELWWLIRQLIEHGGDRHLVLRAMRELGFRDSDIADAFSMALLLEKGDTLGRKG
ncbi:MAG: DUF87 domain-containing protein [Candidatus Micrarchaeota archaeon]|nr:DUF87 domain-containing protein [Candidatus Micrarchaeota archaeon]